MYSHIGSKYAGSGKRSTDRFYAHGEERPLRLVCVCGPMPDGPGAKATIAFWERADLDKYEALFLDFASGFPPCYAFNGLWMGLEA